MKEEEVSWEQYNINKVKHQYNKKVYKIRQKNYEKQLAKQYFKHNNKKFWWLKIIIILAILSNMGALLLTNATVVKSTPTTEIYELNPTVCGDDKELECHPVTDINIQGSAARSWMNYVIIIFWVALRPSILAAMMIYLYHSIKISSYSHKHFYMHSSLIIFVAMGLGYDFVNDLGYWIGRIIWA